MRAYLLVVLLSIRVVGNRFNLRDHAAAQLCVLPCLRGFCRCALGISRVVDAASASTTQRTHFHYAGLMSLPL